AICGASSARSPARTLITPAGKSLVAMISENVSAGSGFVGEARTTAQLPLKITGITSDTKASNDGSSGQITTTTPVGSGIVKLKCELATGFTAPKICVNLSVQPAKCTSRSIASVVSDDDVDLELLFERAISFCNSPWRISSISAARYKICPRRYALCFDQFGNAFRAARTASRKSFFEARQKLARSALPLPRAGKTRPFSPRTNLPPMKSL